VSRSGNNFGDNRILGQLSSAQLPRTLCDEIHPCEIVLAQVWGNCHGSSKGELKMLKLFRRFARDESGATAIEYGLIAAGISVAIIVVVQAIVR